MPQNRQERMRSARNFSATPPVVSDELLAKRTAKEVNRLVKAVGRVTAGMSKNFNRLSPATALDKRSAFFDVIAAEPDGQLTLEDLGDLFDCCSTIVNDFRMEGEGNVVMPFTRANVDYYGINGVSD